MKGYQYLNDQGVFQLEDPELTSYLYFPIANESGVMSCVTPTLGGDSKMGQNTFLLEPVSSENLHNNKSSRNFWCNIEGKGIWSATGKSAEQEALIFTEHKEKTLLEAGVMWHKMTRNSGKYGITSEIISFVPYTEDNVELMIVTIKNDGEMPITFTATAAIPLYGRSADNIRDHRNVTSLLHRIETTEKGIILNPTLTFDERGHRTNTMVYGVFGVCGEGEIPAGFYPSVESFLGEGGTFEHPRSLFDKTMELIPQGVTIDGYEAMGGLQFTKTTLEAHTEKTYIVVMGYGTSKENLENTAEKFLTKQGCLISLEATKIYWENKINVTYRTGSKNFDAWMHWVNFQPILRRIYGCSFLPHHDYGRGGRGWRDLWQDCLALLIMNPEGVREMLISNFGGIRIDGTNATIIGKNQGEFIADRNNITRVWMDHGVWPLLTTYLYIMQSGDVNILLHKNYYFKDPQAGRGEERDLLWEAKEGNHVRTEDGQEYRGSILEHLLLEHLTAFYDVGEHNHIRLRGADWNDALDMAKERGESVAFTAAYCGNLEQLAELIKELDAKGTKQLFFLKEIEILLTDRVSLYDNITEKQELLKAFGNSCLHTISGEQVEISCTKLAENLKGKADWMKAHIRSLEWIENNEGHSWYNSYYDNHGRQVEGDHDNGVRMMLTGQVFTIMSGIASEGQVEEMVSSADRYLYEEKVGGYRLNTDFKEVKEDLGRMFGFAYGHKENGAVFSHMTVMYANALYQRGFVVEGYKAINSLYRHCSNFEKSRIYPGVPEYIGDNGRGLYHYLTGSASWLLLTVLTEMFGVKGKFGNLVLKPKLMLEQFDENNKASVEFMFADRKLQVEYHNDSRKEYGEYHISETWIDGEPYNKNTAVGVILRSSITDLEESKDHRILVRLN